MGDTLESSTASTVQPSAPSTGADSRRWFSRRMRGDEGQNSPINAVHALPASRSVLHDILSILPRLRRSRGAKSRSTISPDTDPLPVVQDAQADQSASSGIVERLETSWTDKTYDFLVEIDTDDINAASACGGGGFGVVYCVSHRSAGKVALKKLRGNLTLESRDEQLKRILREGETWLTLAHPNILKLYGVVEACNDMYLVTPYLHNGSLSKYLESHPDADRLSLIHEIAAALAYLHALKLIHGDVKASNILVSDDIHAILCDFGLARPITEATSEGLKGSGNHRWQSPELWKEGASKSEKSDVWAFGMTVFEILSGKLPFHEYNEWGVLAAVELRDQRPSKGPSHSNSGQSYNDAWTVASDCWHKDPAQRPTMESAHRRLLPTSLPRTELITTLDVGRPLDGEEIGKGGLVTMFVVHHPTAGPLALKRMRETWLTDNPAQRRRALRAAETWAMLDHPNVVPFLGILESDGEILFVSHFLKNGSLAQYALQAPDMDRPRLLREAAAGIMYLHGRGIIHGDIKGSNILVSDDIHAQLCDFGLAKALEDSTSSGLTDAVSPRWMSPELFDAHGTRTFKSDVWAFGMLVIEILTGAVPFSDLRNNTAVVLAITQHRIPPMVPAQSSSGFSYEFLWGLVGDLLQRDPDQRPTIGEAHRRLDVPEPGPSSAPTDAAPNAPSFIVAGGDLKGLTQDLQHAQISSDSFPLVKPEARLSDVQESEAPPTSVYRAAPSPPSSIATVKNSISSSHDIQDIQQSTFLVPSVSPFVPGWYRAVYPFEAQGVEEMSLEVGQLYECEERGGHPGDGWVNAARMVRKVVNCGLVPEAYLEFVQPI